MYLVCQSQPEGGTRSCTLCYHDALRSSKKCRVAKQPRLGNWLQLAYREVNFITKTCPFMMSGRSPIKRIDMKATMSPILVREYKVPDRLSTDTDSIHIS